MTGDAAGFEVLLVGGTAADEAAVKARVPALTCTDLGGARAAMRTQRFDLVLVDAALPPAEVFDAVRGVPLVVVSDEHHDALVTAWLDAGAFDFVTRPGFLVLGAVMAKVRRQREQEAKQQASTAALLSLAKSRSFSGTALDAAFREILEAAARIGDTAVAGIWGFDRPAGVLRNLAQLDRRTGTWSSGLVLKFADFPAYFRALEDQQQIVANDAYRDPRTAELAGQYLDPKHVRALIDTGVRIAGELKGILCLERAAPAAPWTPDELVFASALAEVTAVVFAGAERTRAQESEDRFRELFAHSRDAIILYRVEADGTLTAEELNPATTELMRMPREALIGKTLRDVLPAASAEPMMERHQQVLRDRRPVSYELRLTRPRAPSGSTPRWCRCSTPTGR